MQDKDNLYILIREEKTREVIKEELQFHKKSLNMTEFLKYLENR